MLTILGSVAGSGGIDGLALYTKGTFDVSWGKYRGSYDVLANSIRFDRYSGIETTDVIDVSPYSKIEIDAYSTENRDVDIGIYFNDDGSTKHAQKFRDIDMYKKTYGWNISEIRGKFNIVVENVGRTSSLYIYAIRLMF